MSRVSKTYMSGVNLSHTDQPGFCGLFSRAVYIFHVCTSFAWGVTLAAVSLAVILSYGTVDPILEIKKGLVHSCIMTCNVLMQCNIVTPVR